jgi:hypothetical protein
VEDQDVKGEDARQPLGDEPEELDLAHELSSPPQRLRLGRAIRPKARRPPSSLLKAES